jgi:septal ring factor EnvC (AmiA/AmiB activator)
MTTYALRPLDPLPSFTDTARDVIRDIRCMSTQTKARLEHTALILGLILTVCSALKVFVFLPSRVNAHDQAIKEIQADVKAVQAKASTTDVAIARMEPQLAAINQGIAEIKADVRDIRRGSTSP